MQSIYDQILNTILSQEKPAFLLGKKWLSQLTKGNLSQISRGVFAAGLAAH